MNYHRMRWIKNITIAHLCLNFISATNLQFKFSGLYSYCSLTCVQKRYCRALNKLNLFSSSSKSSLFFCKSKFYRISYRIRMSWWWWFVVGWLNYKPKEIKGQRRQVQLKVEHTFNSEKHVCPLLELCR